MGNHPRASLTTFPAASSTYPIHRHTERLKPYFLAVNGASQPRLQASLLKLENTSSIFSDPERFDEILGQNERYGHV